MKTIQVYYDDPYLKTLNCRVIDYWEKNTISNIVLDKTIFYPEGGGQPCDTGMFSFGNHTISIDHIHIIEGEIVHQSKNCVDFKTNENTNTFIDWNNRHRNMRAHSAGHLLHDTLMELYPDLVPIRGSHGKKAFLEYKGQISPNDKENIEKAININLEKDSPIITKEIEYQELTNDCQFIPQNLPTNKPLRIIKIGDYKAMPDGGVHVKATKEIGKIWIANIINSSDSATIRYGIV